MSEKSSTGVWISGSLDGAVPSTKNAVSADGELERWWCSYWSFTEKCKDDEILVADIKKAVAIPSNSILLT